MTHEHWSQNPHCCGGKNNFCKLVAAKIFQLQRTGNSTQLASTREVQRKSGCRLMMVRAKLQFSWLSLPPFVGFCCKLAVLVVQDGCRSSGVTSRSRKRPSVACVSRKWSRYPTLPPIRSQVTTVCHVPMLPQS
jgi:hypothetical protein